MAELQSKLGAMHPQEKEALPDLLLEAIKAWDRIASCMQQCMQALKVFFGLPIVNPTPPTSVGASVPPPPPGTCFNFHSSRGVDPSPLDPLPPSPVSSSAPENPGFGNFC